MVKVADCKKQTNKQNKHDCRLCLFHKLKKTDAAEFVKPVASSRLGPIRQKTIVDQIKSAILATQRDRNVQRDRQTETETDRHTDRQTQCVCVCVYVCVCVCVRERERERGIPTFILHVYVIVLV